MTGYPVSRAIDAAEAASRTAAGEPGTTGTLAAAMISLAPRLDAHGADRSGRGADQLDARASARIGEIGVLAEKAVPRMHGVGTGSRRHFENTVDIQVALRRGSRTEGVGLVGQLDMP